MIPCVPHRIHRGRDRQAESRVVDVYRTEARIKHAVAATQQSAKRPETKRQRRERLRQLRERLRELKSDLRDAKAAVTRAQANYEYELEWLEEYRF